MSDRKRIVDNREYYFLLFCFVVGIALLVSGIVLMYQNGRPEVWPLLVFVGGFLCVFCPLILLRTPITVVEVVYGDLRIESIYRAHTPFEYSESNWVESSDITAIDIEKKRNSDIGMDDEPPRAEYSYHVILRTKDDRPKLLKQFSYQRGAEKMKKLLETQLGLRNRR